MVRIRVGVRQSVRLVPFGGFCKVAVVDADAAAVRLLNTACGHPQSSASTARPLRPVCLVTPCSLLPSLSRWPSHRPTSLHHRAPLSIFVRPLSPPLSRACVWSILGRPSLAKLLLSTARHLCRAPASLGLRRLHSGPCSRSPLGLWSFLTSLVGRRMAPMSSPIPPPPASRRLTPSDGPMVWIDCEMTGLLETDRLLEVAVVVTDGDLEPLDAGVSYVIKTQKQVLDGMGEWCVKQHGKSGLTSACLSTEAVDHQEVRKAVLAYILDRIPQRGVGVLAGNSVHADKVFLVREMPEVIDHLHYRIVDVSSFKECIRRWYGNEAVWKGGKGRHRALDDIQGSIEELKTYRSRFLKSPREVGDA
ncbi:Phosphatidylinositol 3,4,5-trisphosphate-dependent Rac exchanger 2 protein [Thecaphora frezii]